jgi:N6-L-threonylcarbamoyladenine synthase
MSFKKKDRKIADMIRILGIESSCDETAAAVVEVEGTVRRVKSDVVASQVEVHRVYGGVVPEIASRAHIEAISGVTSGALREAGVTLDDVDAVAVTVRPGLIGALLVGVNFAKSLAFTHGKPLVPVHHIHAHVAAAYLEQDGLEPPFLAVVVSGGHTSLYDVRSYTEFVELGATRDDAAGEAFDKVGRVIGLPYPAGAAMDRLAKEGDPGAILLPSPALPGDTLDFSFSGIKTAALNYINGLQQKGQEIPRADLAASYTATIVQAISKKAEAALRVSGRKTLVLAGGVAANSFLRAELAQLCTRMGVSFVVPAPRYCGDNGAMAASAGAYAYLAGQRAGTDLNACAAD